MGTPESNFWKLIKKNLPKKCHSTRIESRLPSGVPDCHLAWDGLVFWLELKTTKNNTLRISSNQISWNSAYCLRGGFSFYLAKHTKTKDIYLFGGDQGPSLLDDGLRTKALYRGKSFEDLFATLRAYME